MVVYDTIYKYIQEPVIPQKEQIRRDVFFTINSTVITDAEMQKVKEIAEYLNKYPEAADVVVNTLKKDYGIAENRITYDSYGDKVQPFEENDLNRVSICIAE